MDAMKNPQKTYPAIQLWSLWTGHFGGGMVHGRGMTNSRAARQTEFLGPCDHQQQGSSWAMWSLIQDSSFYGLLINSTARKLVSRVVIEPCDIDSRAAWHDYYSWAFWSLVTGRAVQCMSMSRAFHTVNLDLVSVKYKTPYWIFITVPQK